MIKKNRIYLGNSSKSEVLIYDNKETKFRYNLELIQKFKSNKLLVLTFDDGPSNYTTFLVDELKKRNVSATFFILGYNIKGRENILKKVSQNNEIALHSYSHKLFTKLSNNEILEDITLLQNEIYNVLKIRPNVIRVPYGSVNSRISALLLKNNYINVKWDVDSCDWKFRNADKTFNYTMKYIKGNNIILMHDIYKPSVECAIKLIDALKDEYTFVTLSQFLEIEKAAFDTDKP